MLVVFLFVLPSATVRAVMETEDGFYVSYVIICIPLLCSIYSGLAGTSRLISSGSLNYQIHPAFRDYM